MAGKGVAPRKSAAGVLRSASSGYRGKEGKSGAPSPRLLAFVGGRSVAFTK